MGAERFRVIARAIILSPDRRVLLVTSRDGRALVLPGGAVDRNETLPQAAAREAREECGVRVSIERAIWVREFFNRKRGHANLEVYFLAQAAEHKPLPDRWAHEDPDTPGQTRQCGLYSRADLESMATIVYPVELRDALWVGLEGGFENAYLGRFESSS
jgi:8-oxo-dGTP pyrophosphatase MutT (NUDIX family)